MSILQKVPTQTSTKIICTIGPASESRSMLRKLLFAGMRVARLNFSHGSYEHHQLLIDNIRQASYETGIPCALLQDLQGPKLRVGILAKPLELTKGEEVSAVFEERIEDILRERDDLAKIIPLQYDLSTCLKKRDTVLIDDGIIELKVLRVYKGSVSARVVSGGSVISNKGINIPGRDIRTEVITKKDKLDLHFGLKARVDAIALSFVSSARDITDLKHLIEGNVFSRKVQPLIIAKIERAMALQKIDEIISAADGIMIARGDLGLEIEASDVPLAQKEIISKCLERNKTVIVATQMLDSMARHPRPTRAEVSDVASAVIDHADALMLSAETAFGKYPLRAVETMSEIINKMEMSPYDDLVVPLRVGWSEEEALSHAAWTLGKEVDARAILVTTLSGYTSRVISRFRPSVPILVTCDSSQVQRQLLFSWGLIPLILPRYKTVDILITRAVSKIERAGMVKKGDTIVIVSGQPVGHPGANLLKVHRI